MLQVEYRGNIAVVDVRERINRGEHPKQEIVGFVNDAKPGTIIELHLPHRADPLVQALKSVGISAIMNEMGPSHYRVMCVKI